MSLLSMLLVAVMFKRILRPARTDTRTTARVLLDVFVLFIALWVFIHLIWG